MQRPRVFERCQTLCRMLELPELVEDRDILLDDSQLAPGYGKLNENVYQAIFTAAKTEGILLDPTYTGKAMAGLLDLLEHRAFEAGQNVVFLHTGGLPGAFGYPELMEYETK